ncbi:TIGR00730 family Rossman fold protein [Paucilactobacillus suebicus]
MAVYCGASIGNDPVYQQAGQQLGQWLAENNIDLVYGGGRYGLMGTIAKSVLDNHGVVWGVITKELEDRGTMLESITHIKVVENMAERKLTMMNDAQAFLAFPGGPGTLEEITEAFSWALIGDNQYPCAFYNVNDYYQPLADMYDRMVEQGFLEAEGRQKLLFSDSIDEIMDFMSKYEPPMVRTYHK